MAFKKIVVAGGGVLGSQIALQTAYWGYDVTIWLPAWPISTRSTLTSALPAHARRTTT